ncbi:hypothetical protein QLH51_04845 [Sphingomonas sp. 2R-10]|uniref:hypothetical protein n=1 Tax=Sphingomonas sp. 2R-10 TaxID=3045148 RepID=UPI000F7A8A11|nr:hypothetical protein [Sphingomonas sp. 2R-10]MDJ0276132.1 hypothetical protein [Sphingomonas sp. 2R-10]
MAGLSAGHVAALAVADAVLRDARKPWWVIAGAAVALHTREPIVVDDIDILLAVEDVPLVAALSGIVRRECDGHALFRSDFYAAVAIGTVTIEFMAGFRSNRQGLWCDVWPRTRIFVPIGNLSVPTPCPDELIEMLAAFGRPKDLARAALLAG